MPDHAPHPPLSTERLLLQPLCLDDAPAIQRIFPQWEVVRYLAEQVPWPYPADGARTYVEQVALPAMRRGVQWHWSLRPRTEPDRLIGLISLMRDDPGNHRGFWLDPLYQGQGYMTEASEAVTAYWFEVLGQPVLRAPKAVANDGSRRLSDRTGMRRVATEERGFVSGRQMAEIWEITREEWQARKR
ncbi:GNAT family N-acetyltransferase [Achromobacter deleyi]|uniref:GNAT family N-acetyltransferase n=1 Tax=Achromobacter deleyi TaxID=1353891 RepID=A0A7T4E1A3_9BURK|nr:GNAT family N-acetyltransferase [Achromobacter deleyi]QQB33323.1 GNAT family N-acetyltransferase [Achromobacter deleyi]